MVRLVTPMGAHIARIATRTTIEGRPSPQMGATRPKIRAVVRAICAAIGLMGTLFRESNAALSHDEWGDERDAQRPMA